MSEITPTILQKQVAGTHSFINGIAALSCVCFDASRDKIKAGGVVFPLPQHLETVSGFLAGTHPPVEIFSPEIFN